MFHQLIQFKRAKAISLIETELTSKIKFIDLFAHLAEIEVLKCLTRQL